MKWLLVMALVMTSLTACTSQNVNKSGQIDSSAKSVMVPAGSSGLLGSLKRSLNSNGWKMSVYKGASIIEGTMGKETALQHFDTFNTRYTLKIGYQRVDTCIWNLEGYSIFDISLIDNQSGSEVFTIDGKDCDSTVVKNFDGLVR
ncbi:hypothetical protein [Pseudomonas syringae]|uniref:hypothetical protein n=1 Tax=Pseudomonas syringae TaxID=317 RepID=UPI0011AEF11D|nr:hypothetical protein [Pseudomonas syringae]